MKKLSQRDMAGYLGVTTVTIRNWRRDKPNLYEIILKGFAFDEAIKESKQNYERLENLASSIRTSGAKKNEKAEG